MKFARTIFIWIAILGACYPLSFYFFLKMHLITGIVGGHTTTYVALPNTALNRGFVVLYAPLLKRSFPAGSPIMWE